MNNLLTRIRQLGRPFAADCLAFASLDESQAFQFSPGSRSGCWSRTISCSNLIAGRQTTLAKLKLGTITDDKPVRLTVELPASVHRDLLAYGRILAREISPSAGEIEPAKLVGPMLARFMATDRVFLKLRRTSSKSEQTA